ncbi:MAG: hypothetical protein R2795_23205 [Saprospiraceae bacterium]
MQLFRYDVSRTRRPRITTANAFFAGWDATDNLEQDTIIGIHHLVQMKNASVSNLMAPPVVGAVVARVQWNPFSNCRLGHWHYGKEAREFSYFNSDKRVVEVNYMVARPVVVIIRMIATGWFHTYGKEEGK